MFLDLNITNKQIFQKELELSSLSIDEMFEVQKELQDFFADKETSINDIKYWYSYFRWYVKLTTLQFNQISTHELVDDVAKRMVPMMFLLDVDVWQKLMWYFTMKPFDQKEIEQIYQKFRSNFLNSDHYFGIYKEKEIYIKDVVKEITIANNKGNDSLLMAKLRTKYSEILFPNDGLSDQFIFANKNEAVGNFIAFVHFLLGVEGKSINNIIDAYNKGEFDTFAETPTKNQNTQEQPTPDTQPPPTPAEIKMAVDATFETDDNGQYTDISGVFDFLHTLANQYQDQSIAEQLYFDEQTGSFIWKN